MNAQSSKGATALHLAARHGHTPVVKVLLTRGADPSPAMTVVTQSGQDEQVSLGGEETPSTPSTPGTEDSGWTPLHFSSFLGHQQISELLIGGKADINPVTSSGMGALYLASQNGEGRIVKCLLRAGAYVNQESRVGCVPLTVAAGNGHSHVVELLLQYEADVNHVATDPQR